MVKPSSGLSRILRWRTIMAWLHTAFAGRRILSMNTPVKSVSPGKRTSGVEVTNVSSHGFWLLLRGEELFVPFSEFPWFRDASIAQIGNVQVLSPGHLYWAALDIDLAVESIREPAKFPLIAKS